MSRRISFRGLLEDGGQETISLQTNKGLLGYRIVKFEIMASAPGITTQESVVMIWKDKQSTVVGTVDFSNNRLLGAAILQHHDSSAYQFTTDVIFDNEIVNQDIYVTHKDVDVGQPCNWYLELEQFALDLNEATVATLKDIRNND